MKNNKTINKIIILILLVVLIAGIVMTVVKGLNFDLEYAKSQELDLYITADCNMDDVRQIVKEVMGNNFSMQNIEIYGDATAIKAKEITDEQKEGIVNKVNEKYGTELNKDEIEIKTNSHVRGRDIIKNYIVPFAVATAIILVYLLIRYFKLGIGKVLLKTIAVVVLAQLELLSIMAITRYPIGISTIPIVLIVYTLTLVGLTSYFEKKLQEVKEVEEEKEED